MNPSAGLHLGKIPDIAVLDSLADFVCGDDTERFPVYRSSSYLTKFFQQLNINATHDGSTRKWWVLSVLQQLNSGEIERVVLRLVDIREYKANKEQLRLAVLTMNGILAMEGLGISFEGAVPIIRRGEGFSFSDNDFNEGVNTNGKDEKDFLRLQFSEDISINDLNVDSVISEILQSRVNEVKKCPKPGAPLAMIFLLGSTLEGMILAVAIKYPARFNSAPGSPKDDKGKVKKLYAWKLSELFHSIPFDDSIR